MNQETKSLAVSGFYDLAEEAVRILDIAKDSNNDEASLGLIMNKAAYIRDLATGLGTLVKESD